MKVLDAVLDEGQWLDRWEESGREPFAHPAYCRLFAPDGGRSVALVTMDKRGGFALVPLIIRPIRTLPGVDDDLFDVVSPYGYGGPFICGRVDTEDVLANLESWVLDSGLCSAFMRLSLESGIPEGVRSSQTEVITVGNNITVNLRRSAQDLWKGYAHKVRKNVNKAIRSGCKVHREDRLSDPITFMDIYMSTMQRRNAATWYRFDEAFFALLAESLEGSYRVFSVSDSDGRMVSVELVLESDRYLYSFLGGTRAEAFPVAPNDLLKHEVALYGIRTGRLGYVLGGGYEGEDGIYRYKRSFDPDGVRQFGVVRVVGDHARYKALVNLRDGLVGQPGPRSEYFPAYREPVSLEAAGGDEERRNEARMPHGEKIVEQGVRV